MTQGNVTFGEYNMTRSNIWYHRAWVDNYLYLTNRSLEKDPLWKGRFCVRRLNSALERFTDGSGALLYVTLRFYDRKTQKYWDKATDALEMQSQMFFWMNWFITEHIRVWDEERSPYNDPTNYVMQKSFEKFKKF